MAAQPSADLTGLLISWCEGEQAALHRLAPLVYAELHRLARREMRGERRGHILQTTGLVHEAWLRLVDVDRVRWQNRAHFFAICAELMRRILVDAARKRDARKRRADVANVLLDDVAAPDRGIDVVALDEALTAFAELDPRKAKVVELRFFGGLTVDETGHVLGISPDTVMRDWKTAKLWLLRELKRDGETVRSRSPR